MKLLEIIKLIRPFQWAKNLFCLCPVFFSGHILDPEYLWRAIVAFFVFSFAASSIYCLNDIKDRNDDMQHPIKSKRPIASGAVSIPAGYTTMVVLLLLASALTFLLPCPESYHVLAIIAIYLVLNIWYCYRLKRIAIIDVTVIAISFVLRIEAGGMACGIELSHWIVIMTFLLALFLAFAKRRDDVVIYETTGKSMRSNISNYNITFINLSITIIATVTLVAYIMYTVSPEVIARIGSNYIYTTAIFVLLGILRYLQITLLEQKSGSPTRILMKDSFIQVCILGWGLTFIFFIYIA